MKKTTFKVLAMASLFGNTLLNATQTLKMDQAMNADRLAGLDHLMQTALEAFQIPGAAIGLVVDGKVVLTKGYGLRDREKGFPVTENTLFAIGSCTKAFGASVIAQMVEEELLSWDDPVLKYLPEFRLKDIHAMHHLTIRDSLTHCSGLPRHDFVWYNSKASRRELLSRLPYLEPSSDLRQKFQYNNLMYLVSGLVMESASGQTWEEAIQTRFFTPLGMSRSNCSVSISQISDDFSLPHSERNGEFQAISFRNIDAVGPAGTINSCVNDMVKWIQWNLSDGSIDGKRLLKKETLKAMHLISTPLQYPVFNTPEESPYLFGYGLGWMTGLYKGRYTAAHGGSIDGFMSAVILLPNEKIGVVVLINSDSHPLFTAYTAYAIADYAMGIEEEGWHKQVQEKEAIMKAALKAENDLQRLENTARPFSDYIGEFENPGYGTIAISLKQNTLIATFNDIEYALQHKCYDHFTCAMQLVAHHKFSCFFTRNASGDISEFHIAMEPLLPPIAFKFKAERTLIAEEYLKQFIGTFDGVGSLEIAFEKNRLWAIVSGQSTFELIPERPFLFSLKGLAGFSAHFDADAQGTITQVSLIQPNGTFVLKKR